MPPSGRHEKNEGFFKFELFVSVERDITGFWNLTYLWVSLRYCFLISTARRILLIVYDGYYSLIRILMFGVGCACVAVTSKFILSINQQRYLIEYISNKLEYRSSGGTAYA